MKKIFAVIFVLLLNLNLKASETKYYQIGAAISTGIFSHKSPEFSGTSISVFGPDIMGSYYFKPDHALTAGLETYFSLSRLALVGLHFGNKWYFLGAPKTEIESPLLKIKSYRKISPFFGGEIRRYTYYLSETFATNNKLEQTGEFYNLNALIGLDYIWAENLKLTGSFTRTFVPIAATDGRIKMAGTLFQIGALFNY